MCVEFALDVVEVVGDAGRKVPGVWVKRPIRLDQAGYGLRRTDRAPAEAGPFTVQGEVESEAEVRPLLESFDGVEEEGGRGHETKIETGGGGGIDGAVGSGRESGIVGTEEKGGHENGYMRGKGWEVELGRGKERRDEVRRKVLGQLVLVCASEVFCPTLVLGSL